MESPFNISATAETSDFKFGMQFGFLMPIIKLYPKSRRRGHGLEELTKILGFSFNIAATAETSDFKFGVQLGFAKAHHKIARRRKVGVDLG